MHLLLVKVHKPIPVHATIACECRAMEQGPLPIDGQAADGDNLLELIPGYRRVGELVNGLVHSGRCSIGCNLGHWLAAREMESESVGNGERNTLCYSIYQSMSPSAVVLLQVECQTHGPGGSIGG